ncbi:MAG: BTAD domain-containing putative transcriptional regulator [Bacillota bacterium]
MSSIGVSTPCICFFGYLKIKTGEKIISSEDWKSKKALILFKYLVTKLNQKIQKDILLELLWPESYSDKTHNLHSTIYLLRKDIEKFGLGCKINYSKGQYWFDKGNCIIDFRKYENIYNKAVEYHKDGNLIKAKKFFIKALSIYRGDLLSGDRYQDWVINLRQYYRELYIDNVLRYSTLVADMEQDYIKAAEICQQALEIDPYREELHKEVITYLLKGGKYVKAIKKYREYNRMLSNEFGLSPNPQIKEIIINFNKFGRVNYLKETDILSEKRPGAFLSDHKTFKLIYELEVRRQKRSNEAFAILSLKFNTQLKEEKDYLTQILGSLRRGDVVCSWDYNTLLILLYRTGQGKVQVVKERLKEALLRKNVNSFEIRYKIISNSVLNYSLEKMINSLEGTG